MKRPLLELKALAVKFGNPPVFCAGDVFDNWDSPPELISFALRYLPPNFVMIPGQHDLPNHNLKELNRSAFNVLRFRDSLTTLRGEHIVHIMSGRHKLRVYGYPYGLDPDPEPSGDGIKIALVHKYYWHGASRFPSASDETHISNGPWKGYDVAIIGDNHCHFTVRNARHNYLIWNCGSFMRLSSNQKDHFPVVGILHKSERHNHIHVRSYYLNTEDDCFEETEAEVNEQDEQPSLETIELVSMLKATGSSIVNLAEVVRIWLEQHPVPEDTRKIVLESLQQNKPPFNQDVKKDLLRRRPGFGEY
jgi:DNA repair exonuclease SbcCD nuclease subunit